MYIQLFLAGGFTLLCAMGPLKYVGGCTLSLYTWLGVCGEYRYVVNV